VGGWGVGRPRLLPARWSSSSSSTCCCIRLAQPRSNGCLPAEGAETLVLVDAGALHGAAPARVFHGPSQWLPAAGASLSAFRLAVSAAARAAIPGAGHSAWPAFASLCCWMLLAAWFGRSQFERNLRFDATAAKPHRQPAARRACRDCWRASTVSGPRLARSPGNHYREGAAVAGPHPAVSAWSFLMGSLRGCVVWLPMIVTRQGPYAASDFRYFLPWFCAYALTLLGRCPIGTASASTAPPFRST